MTLLRLEMGEDAGLRPSVVCKLIVKSCGVCVCLCVLVF